MAKIAAPPRSLPLSYRVYRTPGRLILAAAVAAVCFTANSSINLLFHPGPQDAIGYLLHFDYILVFAVLFVFLLPSEEKLEIGERVRWYRSSILDTESIDEPLRSFTGLYFAEKGGWISPVFEIWLTRHGFGPIVIPKCCEGMGRYEALAYLDALSKVTGLPNVLRMTESLAKSSAKKG